MRIREVYLILLRTKISSVHTMISFGERVDEEKRFFFERNQKGEENFSREKFRETRC